MPTDAAFLASVVDQVIDATVDLGRFRCEENMVNRFLAEKALDYHRRRITHVTCWMTPDGDLAGFYTTSMKEVLIDHAPQRERLGLLNIAFGAAHIERFPALLIGMLGVSQTYEGRGLAKHMVSHAIGQGQALSEKTGCRFVAVDAALSERAIGLYGSKGFSPVEQQKKRKTLAMYFDLGPR